MVLYAGASVGTAERTGTAKRFDHLSVADVVAQTYVFSSGWPNVSFAIDGFVPGQVVCGYHTLPWSILSVLARLIVEGCARYTSPRMPLPSSPSTRPFEPVITTAGAPCSPGMLGWRMHFTVTGVPLMVVERIVVELDVQTALP
jgi:hypothetical protein